MMLAATEYIFYIVAVLGILMIWGLWLYYDYRDRSLYKWQRNRAVFHCVKCGEIYASSNSVPEVDCPVCGMNNQKLQF